MEGGEVNERDVEEPEDIAGECKGQGIELN